MINFVYIRMLLINNKLTVTFTLIPREMTSFIEGMDS